MLLVIVCIVAALDGIEMLEGFGRLVMPLMAMRAQSLCGQPHTTRTTSFIVNEGDKFMPHGRA